MLSILKLRVAKKFFIYLNLFYFVALLIPTILIFYKVESLLYEQVRKQAESIYQQIVITKRWIADHGSLKKMLGQGGSLGTDVPRDEMAKLSPRAPFLSPRAERGDTWRLHASKDIPMRHSEPSEGCLAIARHDMVGRRYLATLSRTK